jgi:hypothetical protein
MLHKMVNLAGGHTVYNLIATDVGPATRKTLREFGIAISIRHVGDHTWYEVGWKLNQKAFPSTVENAALYESLPLTTE